MLYISAVKKKMWKEVRKMGILEISVRMIRKKCHA